MKLEKEIKIDGIRYASQYKRAFISMFSDFTREEFKTLQRIFVSEKIKLTLETEEPILDEEERKYLNDVIRPFKDRVKCIKKLRECYDGDEYILIRTDRNVTPLPYFKKGLMYKGMEINKEYTLEDLGL